MVAGVNLVHRTTRLSDDTGIGLLFVGMLALGVIIISRNDTGAGDLTSFLFGDILGVDRGDIVLGARRARGYRGGTVARRSPLVPRARGQPREGRRARAPPRARARRACWALLALAVVVSFRVVGTLLVFGFLVAPAATAVLVVRRIPRTMAVAVLFAWLSVVLGIIVRLPRRDGHLGDDRRGRRRDLLRRARGRRAADVPISSLGSWRSHPALTRTDQYGDSYGASGASGQHLERPPVRPRRSSPHHRGRTVRAGSDHTTTASDPGVVRGCGLVVPAHDRDLDRAAHRQRSTRR